jgi:hypothetical protein
MHFDELFSPGLVDNNFCRNPYNTNDINKAATIWCFTTDTSVKWQTCTPVGVIAPAAQCICGRLSDSDSSCRLTALQKNIKKAEVPASSTGQTH